MEVEDKKYNGQTKFGEDALSRLFFRTVIPSSSPICPDGASEAMEPALPNVLPPELLYKVRRALTQMLALTERGQSASR